MNKNKKKHKHTNHDLEHRNWSRRSFIQALGIVGSGSLILSNKMLSASKPTPISSAIANSEIDNILVLIRLSGGNDGLSTVIPLNQFDLYANARPNIYIPTNEIIKLTDDYGIPDYMGNLEEMWKEGQFKVIHGVGMDTQSLSHFTGSEVWSNADITTTGFQGEETGWIGRYFDDEYSDFLTNPPDAPPAIQVGSYGDILFDGEEVNYGFIASNIKELESIAQTGEQYQTSAGIFGDCTYDGQLKFLRAISNTTYKYSGIINEAYELGNNQVEYSTDEVSTQLALIARLIKGNLGTKVFMITLGGFDTHANQKANHKKLMTKISNGISSFYKDLAFTGQDKLVLSMTYSEFGRRIDENGSLGTDHGKAAPLLMFGGGLNGSGFVGDHPGLESSDNRGNLEFNVDFRDVYATVLGEWMCIPTSLVEQYLLGRPYTPLNLGFNCNSLTTDDTSFAINKTSIYIYYPAKKTTILRVNIVKSGLLDVQIFDLGGRNVGTVFNEIVLERSIEINIQNKLNTNIPNGIYICRVETNNKVSSKKINLNF